MSMPMSSQGQWGRPSPTPSTTQILYGMPSTATPPAYTTVQARQNFDYLPLQLPVPQYIPPSRPQYVSTVDTESSKKKRIEWPIAVRNYVQRSFDPSNMVADVSKVEMEEKLKKTISTATDTNALLQMDWDNLSLPQQMIRAERAQVAIQWRSGSTDVHVVDVFKPAPQETKSRKRKSIETNEEEGNNISSPPWRNTNTRNGFEDRITFEAQPVVVHFDNDAQAPQNDVPLKSQSKSQKNMEKRQRRFDGGYKSAYKSSPTPEVSTGPVVGKCMTLEKKYFRLTAPPNPETVRPLSILKQTLELLKKKWKKEANYSYICDQFKSVRQDLTVQRIKDKFTVEVYEIHARIALEKGDLGEYNQCQTQLRALYAQRLGGNPMEFMAYRILYFIHTCNRTSLSEVLTDLTTAEKEDPAIKHALSARSALALGNYNKFFRLYLETPNMGAYLMDTFVVRERLAALTNICKAYKPDVKLRFITEELGFESDADAAQFICEYNGQELLEEREDCIKFFTAKAGLIFENAKAEAFRKVDIKGQI